MESYNVKKSNMQKWVKTRRSHLQLFSISSEISRFSVCLIFNLPICRRSSEPSKSGRLRREDMIGGEGTVQMRWESQDCI